MRIDDGHPTTLDIFDDDTDPTPITVKFWEKTLTPPGMDGGGANDTTTMRNTRMRTRAPKKLYTLTEFSITVAYDPEIYDSLIDLMQQNKWLVINFPDGSTLGFWGWLDGADGQEISEGSQPEMELTVIPGNQDLNGEEVEPVYTAPSS